MCNFARKGLCKKGVQSYTFLCFAMLVQRVRRSTVFLRAKLSHTLQSTIPSHGKPFPCKVTHCPQSSFFQLHWKGLLPSHSFGRNCKKMYPFGFTTTEEWLYRKGECSLLTPFLSFLLPFLCKACAKESVGALQYGGLGLQSLSESTLHRSIVPSASSYPVLRIAKLLRTSFAQERGTPRHSQCSVGRKALCFKEIAL